MSKRKSFADEFKKQIVALYTNGKPVRELVRGYSIGAAAVYKWSKEYDTTGSFKAADNRTHEENELIELRKEVKQLRMENDILKQAALIMGRK